MQLQAYRQVPKRRSPRILQKSFGSPIIVGFGRADNSTLRPLACYRGCEHDRFDELDILATAPAGDERKANVRIADASYPNLVTTKTNRHPFTAA